MNKHLMKELPKYNLILLLFTKKQSYKMAKIIAQIIRYQYIDHLYGFFILKSN